MNERRGVTLLGATGTIGRNTLDVLERHSERYRVVALSAHSAVDRLFEQCCAFKPEFAAVVDHAAANRLRDQLKAVGSPTEVLAGEAALEDIAALPQVDTVMAAIVGAAGLRPALAAARAGKRILLANKETLVMSGHLFMETVKAHGATLLPIDSEHNAIFQALPRDFDGRLDAVGVRRILLTASGGPFRRTPLPELAQITPEQACAHPNWVMGKKISVDSATMMNKGLEVIEAHWLFNASAERIQVVIHPQSIIHSLVEYVDGSVIAQLGNPDMRTPIGYALGYPDRLETGVSPLDLFKVARIDFEEPDLARFPCLALAFQALQAGGTAPAVLNAANEVAVAAFLEGRLAYTDIPVLIESVLADISVQAASSLDDVVEADRRARECARRFQGHRA
ncbi:MAG: 1-deoxy-D-xylulose-5-phosphate reductoisomerase [Betaproteobacteria bacterium]|nr:1-deoxy-D-xylulose-5-phosphate reductoisomerase [Betaproteobacteria bacterium]